MLPSPDARKAEVEVALFSTCLLSQSIRQLRPPSSSSSTSPAQFTCFFASETWIEHRWNEKFIVSWLALFSNYFWIYFRRNWFEIEILVFPPYLLILNFYLVRIAFTTSILGDSRRRWWIRFPPPSVGSVLRPCARSTSVWRCEETRASTRAMLRTTETSSLFFIQLKI